MTHTQRNDFFDEPMSAVDVKSLFKSGKKTIKAFKIAAGPAKTEEKAADDSIEGWETSEAPAVAPIANVALEEFKEEKQEEGLKAGVSWSQMYVLALSYIFVLF